MLLTRSITRSSIFRILSHDSVSKVINTCLIQEINIKYPKNTGYLVLHSKKYSNKSNNVKTFNYQLIAYLSSNSSVVFPITQELTPAEFERISDETLDSLTEYFDELIEQAAHLSDADVSYGDGVLTVKFGKSHGTYVINRQTPNKQIWLSSPTSGPKRYDFINGRWIYKHDGKTLHELLNNEIAAIIRDQTNFDKCSFSGKEREATMTDL
ncbi:frataxin homolog, mitochondrial [Bombus pyrosoma]|uniref:frataxin homolog, mitochondrial n=1 Tax=Bombus pyrosoma TaxID=396416 RepID=UPI001CB93123|nr:frataxin homolog, mitochondrial [Bombus pyrosoma]